MNPIENWLYNELAGKLVARAAVTIAAVVAGPIVQGYAHQFGVPIGPVDPVQLAAGMTLAAHGAFELWKAWRAKATAPVTPAAP